MKTLKIKTQNVYSANIDDQIKVYEVDDNAVIGITAPTLYSADWSEDESKKDIKLDLYGLWVKCKHSEKYDKNNIAYACSQKFVMDDGDFIGFISYAYDIEYDGKILSTEEMNAYFYEFFSDKLIVHDSYRYGILSIFRIVSFDNPNVNALHMMLRDCFREGRSVFTVIYQDFKFDGIFRDQLGNDNFEYTTRLTNDESIKAFFNNKISKLFKELTVK